MPESLVNTKRRINTIRSTMKITKAMKLVASVKYQRWKKMYDENAAYTIEMQNALERTLASIDFSDVSKPDLLSGFENTKKNLYIIVTSSLGLCGSYNYNLFKEIDPQLKEGDELFLLGQKGLVHYQNKSYKLYTDYLDIQEKFTYSAVRRMRHEIIRLYRKEKYAKVVLVYTQYKNSITFIPTLKTILPLSYEEKEKQDESDQPLFEPDAKEVLLTLIPHSIDASLYHRLIESQLSELASRRNAMETATDSADKIQAQLQLEYNKARQTAITQEITEIVAGANAGKEE